MTTKKSILFLALFFSFSFFLTSCAEPLPVENIPEKDPYGFLGGLWHGFILFFSFLGSLFKDDIALYAFNNNGGWYNLGYLLGVSIFFGGSGSAKRSKKRS